MDKLALPLIVAAAILGAAVLGSSLLLKSSLDRGTAELSGVRSALGDFKGSLDSLARPSQAAARRGPDPNQRYRVNTQNAPAKGPAGAKVQLVEFSDFQ